MHILERQYLTTLAQSELWPLCTSRAGDVRRAIVPPRLDWICTQTDGFPLLLSRRIWWRAVLAEFCWMMQGRNDLAYLEAHGVASIWQPWALPDGTIGRGYGAQIVRDGRHIIADALEKLRQDPDTRQACWTYWREGDIEHMALPPCHGAFCQLRMIGDGLHLHMHQRSADWAVGAPFNIAFYALLLKVCARWLGADEGGLHLTYGDAHVYEDHRGGVRQQLAQAQEAEGRGLRAPTVHYTGCDPCSAGEMLMGLDPSHFGLVGYAPMGAVKYPVAV